jgi:NhaP-type Na+/H+ or K+/H+ antiporter
MFVAGLLLGFALGLLAGYLTRRAGFTIEFCL